jgi:hypothetical protein
MLRVNGFAAVYRTQCTGTGCANLGRPILRYADGGGQPMSNSNSRSMAGEAYFSRVLAAGWLHSVGWRHMTSSFESKSASA